MPGQWRVGCAGRRAGSRCHLQSAGPRARLQARLLPLRSPRGEAPAPAGPPLWFHPAPSCSPTPPPPLGQQGAGETAAARRAPEAMAALIALIAASTWRARRADPALAGWLQATPRLVEFYKQHGLQTICKPPRSHFGPGRTLAQLALDHCTSSPDPGCTESEQRAARCAAQQCSLRRHFSHRALRALWHPAPLHRGSPAPGCIQSGRRTAQCAPPRPRAPRRAPPAARGRQGGRPGGAGRRSVAAHTRQRGGEGGRRGGAGRGGAGAATGRGRGHLRRHACNSG